LFTAGNVYFRRFSDFRLFSSAGWLPADADHPEFSGNVTSGGRRASVRYLDANARALYREQRH
jgi:hypothetical protein